LVLCGAGRVLAFFSRFDNKRESFRGGGDIKNKMYFDFLYNLCLKHFSF
jgi:hypothetical protein